ncbi:MAG: efflux RND transporter periplasmic adaptor subunit [Burkholderiaceae bacterium]
MSARYTLAPLALACLLALAACQPSQSTNTRRDAPALSVNILRVQPSTEALVVEAIGQTEGAQEVEVRAQVGGAMVARRYVEGAVVKAGDVLFELDRAPLAATLASSRAATREADARLEQTRRERERLEALVKADAASRKELDDARSSEALARAVLEAASAREQDAMIRLDWATVRAPVAGVAGRALANPGALVTAGTTPLTSITQRDSLKVRFALAERELAGAQLDARSTVEVTPRNGGARVAGKLDFIATQIDPTLGTRTLRATLAPNDALLPGQFVRVNLTIGQQAHVFRVPQRAVMQLADGTYAVYLMIDGKAQQRPVAVGQWAGTDWIVTRGLTAGDAVITDQMMRLKPGIGVQLAAPGGGQDTAADKATPAQPTAAPAKI